VADAVSIPATDSQEHQIKKYLLTLLTRSEPRSKVRGSREERGSSLTTE
jgi:hypothetical protein